MSWKALTFAAFLVGAAVLFSSINNLSPLDRIADTLGAMAFISLVCTASVVRALTERKQK